MTFFGAALLGILAGILSGVFGIGGGIVIVPLLLGIFGFHYHSAIGTSLVALLLPVGSLGVWQYYKHGRIGSTEIFVGLVIALGLFLGTFLGAKIAMPIPEAYMRKAFAVIMLMLAVKTWMDS